jgi:predicted PurR-regulated permease PerM
LSVIASSQGLQRLALVGICASAAVFVGGALWYVVGLLAPVLGLFFGGWLLSCLLEPLVSSVMRRAHVVRSVAVTTTYVCVIAVVVLVGLVAAPVVSRQIQATLANLPSSPVAVTQQLAEAQVAVRGWLTERGLPVDVNLASESTLQTLAHQLNLSGAPFLAAVGGTIGVVGSFGIMLLLSVFFLVGGPQLAEQVAQAFGCRFADDVRYVETTVHDAFESFTRAQLLQGFLYGSAVWVCLSIAGVDSAPFVGVAAGLLLIVPVAGSFLAVLLPLVAVVVAQPTATLPVAAALVVLEQLVLNVVGPRLMSKQLGMAPLLVLFGIFAGGQLGGVWGAVFGVPVLAVLLSCGHHFSQRWQFLTS